MGRTLLKSGGNRGAQTTAEADGEDAGASDRDIRTIPATAHGYVQVLDDDALMALAREHDLVVTLRCRPGDFVHDRSALMDVSPAGRCDDETAGRLGGAYATGSRRTPLQDLRFLIDELVEIAARALSPGVNDPFTAMSCLDWLGAAFADLGGRELPSRARGDADGIVRVIAPPETFASLLDRGFGALMQYASADCIAALRWLNRVDDLSREGLSAGRIDEVHRLAASFGELASVQLQGVNAERVAERARQLVASLDARRSEAS